VTALLKYDEACRAIAEVKNFDDLRELENKAEAVRRYGQRARNRQLELDAVEIRFRAERRRGELLLELRESGALSYGRKPARNGNADSTILVSRETPVERVTLKQLDTTKFESAKAQDLARRYDDAGFEAALAHWRVKERAQNRPVSLQLRADDKAEHRARREAELATKQVALPQKRYGLIYADPEWRFEPRSRVTGMDRSVENHYPTSPLIEIMRRPVRELAAEDCVLAIWATVPMLAEAFCVLDAWGFGSLVRDAAGFLLPDKSAGRYVSHAAWAKYWPGQGIGMGHWFRVDHELLLIATRGRPVAPPRGKQWRSLIDVPASEIHSQKPHVVYELFEKFWPNTPKIELNARNARPGWDAWGNEAPQ
jgi:N6-adenosine-specific RNA methylase IME4